ncbi:hypothetical protein ACRE_053480 [Hapsidospora chrysogenum ATCC 11550]|uniref:Uncharacterized protein n=1 Tax=Hapsidospora chrysogenum (strain ATCC 11550 / CBS 779.69 / DSM 880 / IAM 14645 / JCM 23072 / IMI 49137) TaxID=857340 RepID=A0A086T3G0_HAPC1|nr:hypothetical protein ACRE_053480 [Hapsidospora chrysogenum ATCC 11550]
MDGTQHILASADTLQPTPGEPEQVDGRFLLAVVLLVVLPIFIVLPAAALARGTLLGTLLIDAEVATLSSEEESDVEDDNLDELDAAAPAKSYEQVKQETKNDKTGDHLAWPDSFYEW